ncbi:MAG: N-acetylmuramoyl-L-alanine amidase [Leptolyngbya sp. Prado105]|nr:N-acetylmuramoyl-L-alanine amidase [Leptolyngbya sp. Prado105]
MKQVFLFTNSANFANQPIAAALVSIRNQAAAELRAQGFPVSEVPATLTSPEAIAWINRRAKPGDVALSIQTDAFLNPNARGVTAFYRAGDENRRQRAQQLIDQILVNVPTWVDRGTKPDTETAFGSLAFIRQSQIPAIVLTVGFTTSPEDRAIILNRSQAIAQGIASGLGLWNQRISPINISLNGKAADEQGMIVEGNSYIPVDSLSQLALNIKRPKTARLVIHQNKTYIRATDLQSAGIFVGWNSTDRTVILRTMLPLNPNRISSIMGRGYLSKNTLEAFLQQNNPRALEVFPDIAKLYLEESAIEDVNSDIAFTQALIETDFFRFGKAVQLTQNNFATLREVGSPSETAAFPNARTGVRAHIQLLKAYASLEPLSQAIVTPRFRFIERGIAPQIEKLSPYYSSDPFYAEDILAVLRQLYQYQFARTF